ncbi:hypothetical protein K435DRAFT_799357 [Dendrothele bispora CBS 962.96]|uniref:Uncharacterized protein n=1 Tax=Dendrothele bispora (strain CBS 962.96) TaxID=1314807 RepID=A0A4S8LWV7_DENBC|nr:hypothetical protein K435DRAFT_799357 [Dendrothele bispora CBS 962.96]
MIDQEITYVSYLVQFDDLSDEGELQNNQKNMNQAPKRTGFPYGRMLDHVWSQLKRTATPGACDKFAKSAVEFFIIGQLQKRNNRKLDRMPTIEEFIPMRRATIGCGMVEANERDNRQKNEDTRCRYEEDMVKCVKGWGCVKDRGITKIQARNGIKNENNT